MSKKHLIFLPLISLAATFFLLSLISQPAPLTQFEKDSLDKYVAKNAQYFQNGDTTGVRLAIFKLPNDSSRPVFAIYMEKSQSKKNGYTSREIKVYPAMDIGWDLVVKR